MMVAETFAMRKCLPSVFAAACLAPALVGCASIPSSGPTGAQLRAQIERPNSTLPIALVEVNSMEALPASERNGDVFSGQLAAPEPTELVGQGDVLDIAVYESGITLFGTSSSAPRAASSAQAGLGSAARGERLPPFRVNDSGFINFPYVGDVRVAGRTTDEIEELLERGLAGKSQNPQVLVSIAQAVTNSVIVGGDVRQPGRLVLPTNLETLSDVVALAGGTTGDLKDILVRVQRKGTTGEFRLADILAHPQRDFRVLPADRIQVVRAPQSFSVLGGSGRSDQIIFPATSLSLVEAVALSGGANPNSGDAGAIFVFRIVDDASGKETPTVYYFNMMEARSYILAQRFTMRDKDVLYIGNAEANQPTKLIQIVSQLFFPLVTLEGVINRGN